MSRAGVLVVQRVLVVQVLAVLLAVRASAQDMTGMQHEHMQKPSGWTFMQDGVVFAMLNDQGSPRGSTEFRAPNWWSSCAERFQSFRPHKIGNGKTSPSCLGLRRQTATAELAGLVHRDQPTSRAVGRLF